MQDMVRSQFLPALRCYIDQITGSIRGIKAVSEALPSAASEKLLAALCDSYERICDAEEHLEATQKMRRKSSTCRRRLSSAAALLSLVWKR